MHGIIGDWRRTKTFEPSTYRISIQCRASKECSPIMVNEAKNEAKNERLAATIFGTLGSHMCATCALHEYKCMGVHCAWLKTMSHAV